ncbi:hypothetical protein OG21DRAFT_520473 [Imleria badia]|nr:hypothetical protein OG21DRAFT_520473 [Imleria badia]
MTFPRVSTPISNYRSYPRTREQISDVFESLLKLKLRPGGETDDGESSTRYPRWLFSDPFSGGAIRAHKKARLRKGISILVSTLGRLLDHLQNTSSLTIKGIVQGLDDRKSAVHAVDEGKALKLAVGIGKAENRLYFALQLLEKTFRNARDRHW